MGRNKIKIKKIENDRQKTVTFARRRHGLIKKAHELSVLCDCRVAVLIFDAKDSCHLYSSVQPPDSLITRFYRRDFVHPDIARNRLPFNSETVNTENPQNPEKQKIALINEYSVCTNGEGSEDIDVKHTRHIQDVTDLVRPEFTPPATSSELIHLDGSSSTQSIPRPTYHYPVDGSGVIGMSQFSYNMADGSYGSANSLYGVPLASATDSNSSLGNLKLSALGKRKLPSESLSNSSSSIVAGPVAQPHTQTIPPIKERTPPYAQQELPGFASPISLTDNNTINHSNHFSTEYFGSTNGSASQLERLDSRESFKFESLNFSGIHEPTNFSFSGYFDGSPEHAGKVEEEVGKKLKEAPSVAENQTMTKAWGGSY